MVAAERNISFRSLQRPGITRAGKHVVSVCVPCQLEAHSKLAYSDSSAMSAMNAEYTATCVTTTHKMTT